MRPEIDPFIEAEDGAQGSVTKDDQATETQVRQDQDAPAEGQPAIAKGEYKCEVRELEERFNLRGVQVTKVADEKPDPDDETGGERFAMKSFKTFDREGVFSDGYVEVQSPFIVQALRRVIREYPGVTFEGDQIILRGSLGLACVFHYRKELLELARSATNKFEMMHIFLCVRFMEKEFRRNIKTFTISVERSPQPSISFADLWMIFRPGEFVVTGKNPQRQVLKFVMIKRMKDKGQRWVIVAEKLSHDGISFGFVRQEFNVWEYDGTKEIRLLWITPLRFHPECNKVRTEHIERGKKFSGLVGVNYRSYDGLATAIGDYVESHQISINEDLGQIQLHDTLSEETLMVDGRIILDCGTFGDVKSQNKVVFNRRKHFEPGGMGPDDYLICDNQIPGFALTEKRWGWFAVDLILPVQFHTDAFEKLLLPTAQKKLLRALVENHISKGDKFDDFIKGKGKGLVFALHGDPGVGKTFTVESLADCVKQPLYVLMTGELGLTPTSVEHNLNKALGLAMIWNAIVLIDEADVFMEQRSVQDLQRNSLVSIFLRVLEYYRGILFLTTNRLTTIDLAFKSRIHLALKYPALNVVARYDLWKLFIYQTQNFDKDPSEAMLHRLSAMKLNGRQIKNTVRTANILAQADGDSLSEVHINTVLEILKHFEGHFNEETQDIMCSPQLSRQQSMLIAELVPKPQKPEKPRHLRSPSQMS